MSELLDRHIGKGEIIERIWRFVSSWFFSVHFLDKPQFLYLFVILDTVLVFCDILCVYSC